MDPYNEGYSAYINGDKRCPYNKWSPDSCMEWHRGYDAAKADEASCEDEAMERDSEAYMEMRLLGE